MFVFKRRDMAILRTIKLVTRHLLVFCTGGGFVWNTCTDRNCLSVRAVKATQSLICALLFR